jgi:alpha-amylase/alpha-mannosidase (GH57 family)
MHQPNYQEPGSKRMVLPWVRLHATKDYLDMPLRVREYDDVRVTFNIVPSLIDQLQLYLDGGTDRHLGLSRLKAEELTDEQKSEILDSFFSCYHPHMIEPFPRYRELYRKMKDNTGDPILPSLFTSEEMRDLQVWANLVWIDPLFRGEEPVKSLFAKGKHFTEEEKNALLDWQLTLIARIIPTYRELFEQGLIDISFTPYYHPILPLLCDSNSAREAVPGITLPQKRFRHPEDAERQIAMSIEKFEALFGRKMNGMWPSEGAVSEEAAALLVQLGIKWSASDEEVLYYSLQKSGQQLADGAAYAVYDYGPGLKLFFRDHFLSDRIGFVYSKWDTDKAVADFIARLKDIRTRVIDRIDDVVVTVILDGENAWEYFPDDGHEFLGELYRHLNDDPEIRMVTLTEAAESVRPQKLPHLFAGSWINHNFRIWIGHPEDNAAWDLLSEARQALVEFEQSHPDYDRDKIAKAWRQIYIAEGSDWCWWYGDEHRGAQNVEFDRIFRQHLSAVYEYLGLDPPLKLVTPIYSDEKVTRVVMPDTLLTPVIDGRLTHFYEWAGAGVFDCRTAEGVQHRVARYIAKIYFAYDHKRLYICLDFVERNRLDAVKELSFVLTFFTTQQLSVRLPVGEDAAGKQLDGGCEYCLGDILEVAVDRTVLWPDGYGQVGFTVTVLEGEQVLETQPKHEPITLNVFAKNQELFWPT